MKYSDKHPNPKHLREVEPGVIYCEGEPTPCWNCGSPTNFWDLDFQAPLCSEECLKVRYEEYLKALAAEGEEVCKYCSSRMDTLAVQEAGNTVAWCPECGSVVLISYSGPNPPDWRQPKALREVYKRKWPPLTTQEGGGDD